VSESNYIDAVSTLHFESVTPDVWETIQDEGLDEEQDAPNFVQWSMATLPISGEDSARLRQFDDDTVEKFNSFDIALKEKFNGKIIDLIDYEAGVVRLVKTSSVKMASLFFISIPLGQLHAPVTKVAISVPELVSQTNSFSTKRRPGCEASLLDSNPKELYLKYNVKCRESYSDPAGHEVRVKFDVSKVEDTQNANDLDVQLNCSCVAPDTMVRMVDGTEKQIDQIVAGDLVLTHKGRAKRVTAVMNRPSKPNEMAYAVKVKGYRNPLVLSEDHPLAVVRGYELCACGCGQSLPLTYKSVTIRSRWARKFIHGHYKRGDSSPDYSNGRAVWRTPPELVQRECLYFPRVQWEGTTVVDSDFASLLGYYLAEGDLIRHRRTPAKGSRKQPTLRGASLPLVIEGEEWLVTGVRFTLNQNEIGTLAADITNKATRFLGPSTSIEIKPKQHKERKWLVVTIKNPELALEFFRLVGFRSGNKKLSQEVVNWAPSSLLELVSSYVLGDGYFSDGDQSVFSTSKDLITQVSTFLFSQGVWNNYTYQKNKTSVSHRLNWDYRQFPLLWNIMKDRMRFDDRERTQARIDQPVVYGDSTDFIWGDGYIRALRSLNPVQAPSVFYDLEIEDDHSFIANGVVVHNCPAFLYWGAQWNLHQRDGLLGKPRPELVAPTQRMDLRGNFVICKHCKAVLERILPSVQHNIINIVREMTVRKNKEQLKQKETPDRLKKRQEEMKKRQEMKKIRQLKNKEVQKKLLDALRQREEEEGLKQVKHEEDKAIAEEGGNPGVVGRDHPATAPAPVVETPLKEDITEEEPEDEEDFTAMTEQEEAKLKEEHHKKIKNQPHLHKGLPYETEDEKQEHGHNVPTDEELIEALDATRKRVEQNTERTKQFIEDMKKKRKQTSLEASLLDCMK
jgi:hypothetical protein